VVLKDSRPLQTSHNRSGETGIVPKLHRTKETNQVDCDCATKKGKKQGFDYFGNESKEGRD